MSASVPLRRPGVRSAAVAVAALVTGGAAWAGAPGAAAADGGEVRVHGVRTPVQDPRDERTVCAFYLAAADLPGSHDLSWQILPRPNPRALPGLEGTIAVDAGRGHTGPYTLPSGSYQLTWSAAGQRGADRRKPFTVECPPGDQGQPPTNEPLPAPADQGRIDQGRGEPTTPQKEADPQREDAAREDTPREDAAPQRETAGVDWLSDALGDADLDAELDAELDQELREARDGARDGAEAARPGPGAGGGAGPRGGGGVLTTARPPPGRRGGGGG
ncbi:hypothetical protein AAHZ94_32660, partial [Streptomyces sp. HSW2009]|uniref:hypothetical protein n=1 Tax=Streptomyces sp. HSW2009 TaxID=3142890 RepID=UPI0032EC2EB8